MFVNHYRAFCKIYLTEVIAVIILFFSQNFFKNKMCPENVFTLFTTPTFIYTHLQLIVFNFVLSLLYKKPTWLIVSYFSLFYKLHCRLGTVSFSNINTSKRRKSLFWYSRCYDAVAIMTVAVLTVAVLIQSLFWSRYYDGRCFDSRYSARMRLGSYGLYQIHNFT